MNYIPIFNIYRTRQIAFNIIIRQNISQLGNSPSCDIFCRIIILKVKHINNVKVVHAKETIKTYNKFTEAVTQNGKMQNYAAHPRHSSKNCTYRCSSSFCLFPFLPCIVVLIFIFCCYC